MPCRCDFICGLKSLRIGAGLQSVDLDISELVSGLYQIVVRQGNEIQTSRLLVD